MFCRSRKFEKSCISFFPTRFSSNFKLNGKQPQFTTQWDKFVTQCNRLFVLYGDPEVMKLALHEIKILEINATFISSTTLNVMCIKEEKKTEVSSEWNSYFLKPMDPQRFFFHKLSDQYIWEEKISFLPACWWDAYLEREGAKWKILLPCSSINRRTISHFFELLPRMHSYFTHKNIIFGLFTVLFPSAEPFFCHIVFTNKDASGGTRAAIPEGLP